MEIKRSKLKFEDKFNFKKYKSSGVYVNTDEGKIEEVYIVNKDGQYPVAFLLGPSEEWLYIFEGSNDIEQFQSSNDTVSTPPSNTISEDFALKMLAVSSGNVQDVDLS